VTESYCPVLSLANKLQAPVIDNDQTTQKNKGFRRAKYLPPSDEVDVAKIDCYVMT
jgi:hypothetical protein